MKCYIWRFFSKCQNPDWGFSTLTEVFPCFFLSWKANARVILTKTGHGPHSTQLVFVLTLLVLLFHRYFILFYVYFILFYVILYYSMHYFYIILCIVWVYMCTNHSHRVFTQLQLTNISISISNWSSITIWHEQRVFHMKTYIFLWQYLTERFQEWEMFQTKVVEKIKTHITWSSNFFLWKLCYLLDMCKYMVWPERPPLTQ
jgi:hypothetical protein